MNENIQKFLELLEKNRNAFLDYNNRRYARFTEDLKKSGLHDLVRMLPWIISHNQPDVPGYIEGLFFTEGIDGYTWPDSVMLLIKRKYKLPAAPEAPCAEPQQIKKPMIKMFAIMGSVSSIAYTRESDFDFWICYNAEDLTERDFDLYKKKLCLLSTLFLERFNVPAHFYLNETGNLKRNIFGEEDGGGFTTTTGVLLKDEFMRASILLAGQIPFWWAVPPAISAEKYTQLVAVARKENCFDPYIDIGDISISDKSSFLGAAFFQIVKSLENPFKTILKIGLLEKYILSPGGKIVLEAESLKQIVQNGSCPDEVLDSYIFLYRAVSSFIKNNKYPTDIIELVNESFYLKASPQLSKYGAGYKDRKTEVFRRMVSEWNWDKNKTAHLDNFETWEMAETRRFWLKLQKFIVFVYQKIRNELPDMDIAQTIGKSDFTIISRKIDTFFTRKEGKIERWIPFKEQSYENLLYYSPKEETLEGTSTWSVSKSVISPQRQHIDIQLNSGLNLLMLLTWSIVNRIYLENTTQIKIHSNNSRVETADGIKFLSHFRTVYEGEGPNPRNEYLLQPAFILRAFASFNLSCPEKKELHEVALVYRNSWDETWVKQYTGVDPFLQIIQDILAMSSGAHSLSKQCFSFFIPDRNFKTFKAYGRILNDMVSFYDNPLASGSCSDPGTCDNYFLFSYQTFIILLHRRGEKKTQSFKSIEGALSYIHKNNKNKIRLGASRDDPNLFMLAQTILLTQNAGSENTRADQIYVLKETAETRICLRAGNGHYYYFTCKNNNMFNLLTGLHAMTEKISGEKPEIRILERKLGTHIEGKPVEKKFTELLEACAQEGRKYRICETISQGQRVFTVRYGSTALGPYRADNINAMAQDITSRLKSGFIASAIPEMVVRSDTETNEEFPSLNLYYYLYSAVKTFSGGLI